MAVSTRIYLRLLILSFCDPPTRVLPALFGRVPELERTPMELLWEIVGWAGAVAMLGGYMAVSMGWIKAGNNFQTVNLFGSCAFIINGTLHGAWPSVATNVAWFLISAVALLRMRAKQRAAAQEAKAYTVTETGTLAVIPVPHPAANCT